jgi:hypothetical protein
MRITELRERSDGEEETEKMRYGRRRGAGRTAALGWPCPS